MKTLFFSIAALCITSFFLHSCDSNDKENNTSVAEMTNPFDNMSVSDNQSREKIVVISDLHLGPDLSYSETVKHLSRLEQFLNEVRSSKTVKELVIAGDLLDEWYIPAGTATYSGGTQADFIKKIASSNKVVIDAFNNIIKDKTIKVTYVPGNHDMLFDTSKVESILPGINQARDEDRDLIGTYHPDGYPQIAIEHGHRYDFFCNLDPYDNQDIAPGSVLPPGYFFARIAATSFVNQVALGAATKVPSISLTSADASQKALFLYHYGWKYCMENLIWIGNSFEEKVFITNVGGYTGTYSMNDILPYNDANGKITVDLYKNAFTQNNWEKRLKYNNASVMTDMTEAVIGSLKTAFIDEQSNVQYFQNPDSNVRIVIFGHTHIPMIKTYTSIKNEACVYANTGTWVDKKIRTLDAENGLVADQDAINMHFVVITPREDDKNKIYVGLYQYNHGEHLLIDSQTIR